MDTASFEELLKKYSTHRKEKYKFERNFSSRKTFSDFAAFGYR